nr:MAG TPA_asm: major capsid protein [Caudoviricetes sp.]
MKYYTLSLQDVTHIKDKLAPDIIASSVLDNMSVFNALYINVIEDVEYAQSQIIFRRKGGEARRYQRGETLTATLGYMEESKLVITTIWTRHVQNLQNFREKEPFKIAGSNETYNAPVSEMLIREIGKQHAGDVLSNLFFGSEAKGVKDPLGLYDGYWTKIDQAINAQRISKKFGNLVDMTPINDSPETQDGENYDNFVNWVNGWHPTLRNAEHVVVYMSPESEQKIIQSYMRKFTGFQRESNDSKSFRFFGMKNIEIVSHAIIGKGDRMFATVPGNLEFAMDEESNWNAVLMDHDQNDFNNLIFQIQSNAGVRILDINATKFCVNNGSIKQIEQLNGDYQHNTLTVTSNNEAWGKVTVSPEKEDYEEGETVTLTPAAESGYHFVKWSDNVTIDTRSLIYSGVPTVLQAVFEADEE